MRTPDDRTGNVADINHYIKLGPLGQAFAAKERPAAGAKSRRKKTTRGATS